MDGGDIPLNHLGADDMGPFSLGQCHYVTNWIRDDSVPRHTYVRLDIGMASYGLLSYIFHVIVNV